MRWSATVAATPRCQAGALPQERRDRERSVPWKSTQTIWCPVDIKETSMLLSNVAVIYLGATMGSTAVGGHL